MSLKRHRILISAAPYPRNSPESKLKTIASSLPISSWEFATACEKVAKIRANPTKANASKETSMMKPDLDKFSPSRN